VVCGVSSLNEALYLSRACKSFSISLSLRLYIVLFLSTVSYSHSIATTVASLAVSEIFSVKEWRDREIKVRGRSRSFKLAPFDRPYTSVGRPL